MDEYINKWITVIENMHNDNTYKLAWGRAILECVSFDMYSSNGEEVIIDLNPNKVITDIINPKNIDPVSPINILAGLKLCFKNPSVLPSIINVITTVKSSLP